MQKTRGVLITLVLTLITLAVTPTPHCPGQLLRLLAALCSSAVAVCLLAGCGKATGPLYLGDGDTISTMQTEVGQRIAFGGNVFRNHAAEPVELLSAELISESDTSGVALVSVEVVDLTTDQGGILGIGPWPDENYELGAVQPIEGHIIPADGAAVQVLFIVDVEQNGRWEWQSVDVSYVYLGET